MQEVENAEMEKRKWRKRGNEWAEKGRHEE